MTKTAFMRNFSSEKKRLIYYGCSRLGFQFLSLSITKVCSFSIL